MSPARLRRAARGRRRWRNRSAPPRRRAGRCARCRRPSAGRLGSGEPSAANSLRNSADCSGASLRATACVAKCSTSSSCRRQLDHALRGGVEARELDDVRAFECAHHRARLDRRIGQAREPSARAFRAAVVRGVVGRDREPAIVRACTRDRRSRRRVSARDGRAHGGAARAPATARRVTTTGRSAVRAGVREAAATPRTADR